MTQRRWSRAVRGGEEALAVEGGEEAARLRDAGRAVRGAWLFSLRRSVYPFFHFCRSKRVDVRFYVGLRICFGFTITNPNFLSSRDSFRLI